MDVAATVPNLSQSHGLVLQDDRHTKHLGYPQSWVHGLLQLLLKGRHCSVSCSASLVSLCFSSRIRHAANRVGLLVWLMILCVSLSWSFTRNNGNDRSCGLGWPTKCCRRVDCHKGSSFVCIDLWSPPRPRQPLHRAPSRELDRQSSQT